MHVAPADQVHHKQTQPLRAVIDAPALSRALRGKVGGAQHIAALVQIGRDLLLGKRVVAKCDDIRARSEDVVRLFWSHAAACGVFAVDDDKIRAVRAFDTPQQRMQGVDAGLADHVAHGE